MSEQKKTAADIASIGGGNKNHHKSIVTQAAKKIKSYETKKLSMKATAIAGVIADKLISFCEQSEEFARAVVDGEPFTECLNEITSDIGNVISDEELYGRAVHFYFPGAKIEFKIVIHMSEYEANELPEPPHEQPKQKESISLTLDSLLDW